MEEISGEKFLFKHETLCVICYHLYNLKNVKKPRMSVTFSKVALFSLQLY